MKLMDFIFGGESFGCFMLQLFRVDRVDSQMPFPVRHPVSHGLPSL